MMDASGWMIFLKIVEILILIVLVYSDLSLGPSGANITYKKLQTTGPYGSVRHPGTTCKLSYWWWQVIFYRDFWTPHRVLGQLAWNVIYVLRALTEERHLKQFSEYRAYMKKVKYRFIPKIF
jgi:protein-S-isoprenylcysteine O-methyltransferase Ste14